MMTQHEVLLLPTFLKFLKFNLHPCGFLKRKCFPLVEVEQPFSLMILVILVIFTLQEFCSDSPLTGASACTAVDFTNQNKCYVHRTAANQLQKRTSGTGEVTHYVRENCGIYLSAESRLSGSLPENKPNVLKCIYCAQNNPKTRWQHSCSVQSFPAKIACCNDITFSRSGTLSTMAFHFAISWITFSAAF